MKWMIAALIAVMVLPFAFANNVGGSMNITIGTEEFDPLIWLCDSRVVYDDNTEPGRITAGGATLGERINNYAFEGEQIKWSVLVMDKNGINKIHDVYGTVGGVSEVNCVEDLATTNVSASCNARILEESLTGTWNAGMMRYYNCTLTVETPASMYGEEEISITVEDIDGNTGSIDETEFWFLNPVIALAIEGTIDFADVRPGTDSYSDLVLVGNNADADSGVLLDMFITGTDFYSSDVGAMCPTTNQLALSNFRYYVTNGAYSSANDALGDAPTTGNVRARDTENYMNIEYGIGFNNPTAFYNNTEILQADLIDINADGTDDYWAANLLAPGAEMALTFKLSLPEPCNGGFDQGSIYFWGEAV